MGLTHRAVDRSVYIFLIFTNSLTACFLCVFALLFFQEAVELPYLGRVTFFTLKSQLMLKSVVDVSS